MIRSFDTILRYDIAIRYRDTVSRYGIVIQYHDMISFFFYDILLYFYFSKFFYEIKSLNQRIGCAPQASGEMVRVVRLTTNQGTSRRGLGGRIRLKMGGLYIMAYADIICCPTNVPLGVLNLQVPRRKKI